MCGSYKSAYQAYSNGLGSRTTFGKPSQLLLKVC